MILNDINKVNELKVIIHDILKNMANNNTVSNPIVRDNVTNGYMNELFRIHYILNTMLVTIEQGLTDYSLYKDDIRSLNMLRFNLNNTAEIYYSCNPQDSKFNDLMTVLNKFIIANRENDSLTEADSSIQINDIRSRINEMKQNNKNFWNKIKA